VDISARGEMLSDGADVKAHPLLPVAARLRHDLLDLVTRFGLDPTSRARLNQTLVSTGASLVEQLADLVEQGRQTSGYRALIEGEPVEDGGDDDAA
jgi:predicted HD phosphohydrolase